MAINESEGGISQLSAAVDALYVAAENGHLEVVQ